MTLLSKYWRMFATGLAFAVATVLLPLIALSIVPGIRMVTPDYSSRILKVRRLYAQLARLLLWWAQWSGCMKFRPTGVTNDKLSPTLYIANHPSYIDYLVFLSLFPEVGCIVKAGLTRSRILTYLIDSAGYIKNSGESLSIDSCAERLFNGESLIVFPEGTRSDGAKLRKFQRGAAALALRGHCTVVPVFYTCVPAALQKKHSWFEVPDRAFELSLEVGTAFSAQEVLPSDIPEAQARRRLTRYFENLFECRLGYGRATA